MPLSCTCLVEEFWFRKGKVVTNYFTFKKKCWVWRYTGDILEVYWRYTRSILEVYWRYTGGILEIYWRYTGSILEVYWEYTGSILEVYCGGAHCFQRVIIRCVHEVTFGLQSNSRERCSYINSEKFYQVWNALSTHCRLKCEVGSQVSNLPAKCEARLVIAVGRV